MALNIAKQYSGNPKVFGRTAVLFGGLSAEREISLKSGGAVLEALVREGVDAFAIDVQENLVQQVLEKQIDRAFIALHGPGGEDGKVQALLSMLNIPYTGSNHVASAIGMDKWKTKLLWMAEDLPTPRAIKLSGIDDWQACLDQLGGDVFVKPVHEGSSIGMSCVNSAEALERAYLKAAEYDSDVIAESKIDGGEYTVSILGERALPAVGLETNNSFYDFDAKYVSSDTRYLCPAGLSEEKEEQLKSLALKAFKSVGCEGWGRVDTMMNKQGDFFLLEVNTAPGMTDHSLVPMAAKSMGLGFDELVLEILYQTVTC